MSWVEQLKLKPPAADLASSPSTGKVLKVLASGGVEWATDTAGSITALTGNVENRIATFGNTTTELIGESGLTYNGSTLDVTGSISASSSLQIDGNTVIATGENYLKLNQANFSAGVLVYNGGLTVQHQTADAKIEIKPHQDYDAKLLFNDGDANKWEIMRDESDGHLHIGRAPATSYPDIVINKDNGNVGINDSTPSNRLSVNGEVGIQNGSISLSNGNRSIGWGAYPNMYTDANLTYGSLRWNTADVLAWKSDGTVGIGTASPLDMLHVVMDDTEGALGSANGSNVAIFQNNPNASGSVYATLIGGTTGYAGFHFGDKDDNDAGVLRYDLYNDDGVGGFQFWTEGSERMYISSDGRVGIGTSNVTTDIGDVTFGIYNTVDNIALAVKQTDNDPIATFLSTHATGSGVIIECTNATANTDKILAVKKGSGAGFCVTGSGKVGIGTESPSDYYMGNLVVSSGGANAGITIATTDANAGEGNLSFGKDNGIAYGRIEYKHRDNVDASTMGFVIEQGERFKLSADGTATFTGNAVLPQGKDLKTSSIYSADAGEPIIMHMRADDGIQIKDSSGNVDVSFQPNGNVGIGTDSPAELLSVMGGNAIIGDTANTGRLLYFTRNGTISGQIGSMDGWFDIRSQNGQPLKLFHDGGLGIIVKDDNTVEFNNTGNITMNGGGKLGIGTASPSYPLHVTGDAKVSGSMYANEFYGLASDSIFASSGSISIRTNNVGSEKIQFRARGDADGGGGYYTWATGGQSGSEVEKMRLTALGNVGIGTASPGDKLEIYSGHINLSDTYGIYWGYPSARTGILGSEDNDYIAFKTDNTEQMRIIASGNVGIGTASPDTQLHVVSAGDDATGNLVLQSADGTTDKQSIVFKNKATSPYSTARNWRIQSNDEAYGNLDFQISSDASGYANNTVVSFDTDGNVGIGTDSPIGLFHAKYGNSTLASNASGNTIARFENDGSVDIQFASLAGTYQQGFNFGDQHDADIGQFHYIHDDDRFRFVAGTTEIVNIKSTGVGIGTTPDTGVALHVSGTAIVSSVATFQGARVEHATDSTKATFGASNDASIYYNGSDMTFTQEVGSGRFVFTGGAMKFNADEIQDSGNNAVFSFNANGNCGMGVTPNTKLHVRNNSVSELSIDDVNATNSHANAWSKVAQLKIDHAEGSGNAMAFFASCESNERKAMIQVGHAEHSAAQYLGDLALNPLGGAVGIGTTTPTAGYLLTVGSGGEEVQIKTGKIRMGGGGMDFTSGSGVDTKINTTATWNSDIVLSPGDVEALRAEEETGRVGIGGVASPDQTLELTAPSSGDTAIHIDSGSSAWIDLDRSATGKTSEIKYSTAGNINFYAGVSNTNAGFGTKYFIGNKSGMAGAAPNSFFVIETDGKVGIGADSPSAKLEVSQTSVSTDGIKITKTGTQRALHIDHNMNSQTGITSDAIFVDYDKTGPTTGGTANMIGVNIAVNDDQNSSAGTTVNTTGLKVAMDIAGGTKSGTHNNYSAVFTGGNVGIGTDSPSKPLHIYSGDSGLADASFHSYSQLVVEDDNHAGIEIITPATKQGQLWFSDAAETGVGGVVYDHADGGGGDVGLKFYAGGNELIRMMSVSNCPRLMIGPSVSQDKNYTLSLSGNTEIPRLLIWMDSNNVTQDMGSIYFGNNVGGDGHVKAKIVASTATTNTTSHLSFHTQVSNGALAERMRIAGDGTVGIGTTTPIEKLHINGNIIFEGSAGVIYNYNNSGAVDLNWKFGGTACTSGMTRSLATAFSTGWNIPASNTEGWALGHYNANSYLEVLGNNSGLGTVFVRGNLGVGTPTPNANLSVEGNIVGGDVATSQASTDSIAVGHDANATGSYAQAFGYANTSSGGYAFCAGKDNTSSSTATTVFGQASTVSGNSAFGAGYAVKASGAYSNATGFSTDTNSKTSAQASGMNVKSVNYAERTYGCGKLDYEGDAQTMEYVIRAKTTDATAVELTLDESSEVMNIPVETAWLFNIQLVAKRTGGQNENAAYQIKGLIEHDDNDAVTLLWSNIDELYEDDAGWTVTLSAEDGDPYYLKVLVKGASAKTVYWVAHVRVVQVTVPDA